MSLVENFPIMPPTLVRIWVKDVLKITSQTTIFAGNKATDIQYMKADPSCNMEGLESFLSALKICHLAVFCVLKLGVVFITYSGLQKYSYPP